MADDFAALGHSLDKTLDSYITMNRVMPLETWKIAQVLTSPEVKEKMVEAGFTRPLEDILALLLATAIQRLS